MMRTNAIQSWRSKIYFPKEEIYRLLLGSAGFSCALLVARMIYTGTITFAFLLWNLLLAFVPYYLSYQLTRRSSWKRHKGKFGFAFVLWLIFIPNAFYILTDLFHLFDSSDVPRWYDLLLIVSFAWNALLIGILSVRHMEKITRFMGRGGLDWFFVYPVMLLNALGIYIGRFLRYNSWDVIGNPFALAGDIANMVIHPFHYKNAWGMILCFSFFLSILYITFKRMSKTIWQDSGSKGNR